MDVNELNRSLNEARGKGIEVRALVFINPGNPTGQCLSAENIRDLIKVPLISHIISVNKKIKLKIYNI